jgi:hypothetical protein
MVGDRRTRWERRAAGGYFAYIALSAAALVAAGLVLILIAIAEA